MEYGLVLALVAVVAIGGLTMLGGSLNTQLTSIAANITGAGGSGGIAVAGNPGSGGVANPGSVFVSAGGAGSDVAANPGGVSASTGGASSGGTANTSEGNCNGCSGLW